MNTAPETGTHPVLKIHPNWRGGPDIDLDAEWEYEQERADYDG